MKNGSVLDSRRAGVGGSMFSVVSFTIIINYLGKNSSSVFIRFVGEAKQVF
jgi:hypothetical protein